MKPRTANPIIPDLQEHMKEMLQEILHMNADKARVYDTAFTWAMVKELH